MKKTDTLSTLESPLHLRKTVDILSQKQAKDIRIYDLRSLSHLFDFSIIASGLSTTQIDVLRKAIMRSLREDGIRPLGVEGTAECGWILLDYIDFAVHLFTPEKRDYYHLDNLWADLLIEEVED